MSKNSNTKVRLLAVNKLLHDNPDGLSMKEIIRKLDCLYKIKGERKAIYSDLNTITYFCNLQFTQERKYKIEKML